MQTTQTPPAPLEFVRHPESACLDETDENTDVSNATADSTDPDDPTSRILSTPRRSAWPD